MELRISNFKCWIGDHRFNFSEGTTLIKGRSGKGKTTLMKAITWAFYGKIKSVYPSGHKDVKTRVTIFLSEGITITRQRNPGVLKFDTSTEHLEDAQAQARVDALFGKHDLWEVTSYIKQNNHNKFITTNSNEKAAMLYTLVFGDDDPETYLERCNSKISEAQRVLNSSEKEFSIQKRIFDNWKHKYGIEDVTQFADEAELAERIESLKKAKEAYAKDRELSHKEYEQQELRKRLESLKESEFQLTEQLESEPLKQILERHQLAKRLNKELRSLPEIPDQTWEVIPRNVSNSEIVSAKMKEEKFQRCQQELERLELKEKPSSALIKEIDNQERKLKEVLSLTEAAAVLEKKINLLGELSNEDFSSKIFSLEQELSGYQVKPLYCPSCTTPLRLKEGKLDTVVEVEPNKIKQTTLEIQRLKQEYQRQLQLRSLLEQKDKLGPIPVVDGLKDKIQKLQIKKNALSNLIRDWTLLPEIPSKELIETQELFKQYQEYKRIYEAHERVRKNYREEDLLEEAQEQKIVERIQKDSKARAQLPLVIKMMNEVKSKIIPLPERQKVTEWKECHEEELKECEEKLNHSRLCAEGLVLKKNLEKVEDKFNEDRHLLENLISYRNLINKVSTKVLTQTLSNINVQLEVVIPQIFEEMFSLTLEREKVLKTRKETRNVLNFKIMHKGNEYDSFDHLSGGEKDRVSLALTLAFRSSSNSCLLMLDEVGASLNSELREACIETITNLPRKPKFVLCINHEDIEGRYDSIINLEE